MILIIDDDNAIRSSLCFMLKRAHYDAQAVSGPEEAIAVVRSSVPQLILMDMNFTLTTDGAEGLTLLKEIKIFRPEVPVILMTAWGNIQLAVQGMKAGAFDFITKPWNNATLMQRIKTALDVSSEETQTNTTITDNNAFDRSAIIGSNPELMNILDTVKRIAHTNAS
ncbi:MAG: response regulator, partial [Bacteroidaceae bacterium]